MDMYRHNTFKDWWQDVGYIYVIAIVFIALIFLIRHIEHAPRDIAERPHQQQATRPMPR